MQADAQDGKSFMLDAVRVFLNELPYPTLYTGDNLKLQGYNAQTGQWTDIDKQFEDIHEGWNSLDWKKDEARPVFNSVRLYGQQKHSCRFGEVKLVGAEVYDDRAHFVDPEDDDYKYLCNVKVSLAGQEESFLDAVEYSVNKTPALFRVGSDSGLAPITPRYGSVYGDEQVVFRGENFRPHYGGNVQVMIDDVPCTIKQRSNDMIRCETGDRPFVEGLQPKLSIFVEGKGYAATRGQVYRYVSKWSDKRTWGNDLLPVEGEALVIPAGQHLLVDVPVVPRLSFALVQGSLIFESED